MSTRHPTYESEPQVSYLTQVLDEIHHGLTRVPRFQRPFVWTDSQRLELFRSVIDSTPIGSIMVWRTSKEIPCFERLGPHRLSSPPGGSSKKTYLLDGHQRLSTLYAALYPPDHALEYDPDQDIGWSIYYDLKEDDFLLKEEQATHNWWMPLHVVLDTLRHFAFLRTLMDSTLEDKDELIKRADGIAKAIREYKLPVIPVVSDDLDSVTRTFQRINSQGTSMSDVHMVAALTFGDEFDLGAKLEAAQDDLRSRGWDADEKALLQVCKVVVGADLYDTGIDEVAHLVKDGGDDIIDQAVELLAKAGKLLHAWGFYSPNVVPYSHQPILLSAAYDRLGRATRDQKKRLKRWFWLTSFFGAANTSRVQAEHRRVLSICEGDEVDFEDLRPEPLPWRFDFRHARNRATLRLMANSKPRNSQNRILDAPALLALHGHKAVGKIVTDAQRKRMTGAARALASGPENRFIVDPTELTRVRRYLRRDASTEWLESHLISDSAIEALRKEDYESFLKIRAQTIQEVERDFIKSLSGPEYRNRPAIHPAQ